MDKKHKMYKLALVGNVHEDVTAAAFQKLHNAGIISIGQLMDRWEALNLVSHDRAEFKAMLRGFGIQGKSIDSLANWCASFEFRLQEERESRLLYQKMGGKYVPVESLNDRADGMSEGIYLVRVNGSRGYVRSMRSLTCIADEVGWFKIGGKPVLDFDLIAKTDYYAEALLDFVLNRRNIGEMSPVELAQHLAKIMLEVTENARVGYIPKESKSVVTGNNIDPDFFAE